MTELDAFRSLGIALALGLLVGLQREWKARDREEQHEVAAGLRTFGLVGLLGGATGLLSLKIGSWFVAIGFGAVALMTAVSYYRHSGKRQGIGLTTEIALILTYLFGVAVMYDYTTVAAAAAVVATLLLSMKSLLHTAVSRMEEKELYATIKLLLISVVLLPILPNRTFGPWDVFNPFEVWWMVVLIAGISFIGYFAMKIGGARHGAILTGLTGGLASSTAVTLSLSRYARKSKGDPAPLAAGILAACGTMFPRIVVVAATINPELGRALLVPLLAMSIATYGGAFLFWKRSAAENEKEQDLEIENPFQLVTALKFALLLVVILFLGEGLTRWLSTAGLYLLAAASGITDVDAITLSSARMSTGEIAIDVALLAILIAAGVNSLVKSGMALSIGGPKLGMRVAGPLIVALGIGFLLWKSGVMI